TTINALHRNGSALTIRGSITVSLDKLALTGATTSGNGGGIYFDGAGSLDATSVQLRNNHASRGGGLYANGTGSGLSIRLHHDTDIYGNIADHTGGGIRVQGKARLFMLEGGHVSNNTVPSNDSDGAGGGIQIVGPARADIGSAEVSFNSARYGGGISVNSSDGESGGLRFFMTRSGQPSRIENNRAAATGGGLFVDAKIGINDFSRGFACGFGYSIGGNAATNGAAIYLDTSSSLGTPIGGAAVLSSSILTTTPFGCGPEPAVALGALPCAAGQACNTINGNRAEDENGNPSNGSDIVVQTVAHMIAEQVELRGNQGAHVWLGFKTWSDAPESCSNCLIVDNQVTGDLVRMEEGGALQLNNATIAGNAIGGWNVLSLTGDLSLNESLLWQLGKTSLAQSGGRQRSIRNVLASETGSLGSAATIEAIYPEFLDPIHGNYHLAATSHAVDYAAAAGGADLEGFARTIDLSTPNRPGGGPRDLGAYERQGFINFPPDQGFDEVTAPALPAGWTGNGWFTITGFAGSSPNAAFTEDTPTVTDKSLETPPVQIATRGRLRFRQWMDIEALLDSVFARDGVVLEIAIAAGPFTDIFQAGGSFVSGGYDHVIPAFAPGNNPLKGRAVWSGGTQGLYQDVVVNLPASADAKSVRLRWRMGTDEANAPSHFGYLLDDIHIDVDGSAL
ncbi:MAG: hypothetical protein ABIS07_16900, partial [Dokdonella sp.]